MVGGRGGVLGALAQNAGRGGRGGRGPSPSYRAVTVRLRDVQNIRGIAKNESAFDLQLLGMDGKLYLLSKDRSPKSRVRSR
jgi:hypothetical protein